MAMLTQRDVSADLRVTPVKARRLLEKAGVPLIVVGPRSWRVDEEVYAEWKRAQTASARRQAAHVVAQRVRLRAFRDSDLPDFLKSSAG